MMITTEERYGIKRKIGELLGWSLCEFDLIRCGCKGGRPNWEVEHRNPPYTRWAFTAFDADDIYGIHKVTVMA